MEDKLRSKAKTALNENDDKYRSLFNLIDEGFYIIKMIYDSLNNPIDYRFLEINPVFERQTGLLQAEGKSMRSMTQEHEDYWCQIFGRIAMTGKSERFENEAKALNRWFDVFAFRVGAPESRTVAIIFNDITKYKRTEEGLARVRNELETKVQEQTAKLQTSEKKYQSIVETANEGIWICDTNGKITFVNKKMTEMLGYSENQIIGKTLDAFMDEAEKILTKSVIARTTNGYHDRYEQKYSRKDGTVLWVTASTAPLLDKNNHVVSCLGMITDISARKRAEQKLQQSQKNLKDLTDSLKIGVGVVDIADGKFIYVNSAYEKAFGYDRDELIGLTTPDIYWDAEDQKRILELLKTTGNVTDYDVRLKRKDGTMFWGMLSVHPIDFAGRHALLGIFTDISDRKFAEQRLKESEELFFKAFHLSPVGMVIASLPEGRWVEANNTVLRMLDYTRQEVIGHNSADLKLYVEPAERDQVWQILLEKGKLENCEITWLTKTGMVIALICYVEKLILDGHEHAIFILMDNTKRKQTELEVLRLNRELKAIDECDQVIVHEHDEQTLLSKICSILCTTAGYLMAWVGSVEHDNDKSVLPLAYYGSQKYLDNVKITWADQERGRGPTGIAARTGETRCFQDFATEPAAAPWRKSALSQGYRSSIAIPLFDINGSVFQILTLYSGKPNYFNPAEVRLLEELAGNLSFGINTIRERVKRQKAEAEIVHLALFPALNPNPVLELDMKGNLIYANSAVQQCFPDLVFLGKKHPFLADLDNMILNTEPSSLTRDINVGSLWFEQTMTYSAQTKTYLLYARDITARKIAEIELRHRTSLLENSNQELESFSYSISHDLRAPLRSMDGFSLALLEDYGDKLDLTAKEYLQYIRSSSQFMGQLIDDILNLSRITRAEILLDKIDLSGLAHAVVKELKSFQPERNVEFIIAPGLEAYSDRNLLKLVLQNLLSNAFKFTEKQEQARIEFGIIDSSGEIAYFVRDNGVGFDMTYNDKLFKPFQRLHQVEEYAGTGVGLASVQRIINHLGGRVWAEGNPGHGAMFCFTLSKNKEA